MKRLCLVLIGILILGWGGSGYAKGKPDKGSPESRGGDKNHTLVPRDNTHSNGQATDDRDFGKDRAQEVGKGKKKGLYKGSSSISERKEKRAHTHERNKKPKKEKAEEKEHQRKEQHE